MRRCAIKVWSQQNILHYVFKPCNTTASFPCFQKMSIALGVTEVKYLVILAVKFTTKASPAKRLPNIITRVRKKVSTWSIVKGPLIFASPSQFWNKICLPSKWKHSFGEGTYSLWCSTEPWKLDWSQLGPHQPVAEQKISQHTLSR